jgi:hypothetical protein
VSELVSFPVEFDVQRFQAAPQCKVDCARVGPSWAPDDYAEQSIAGLRGG